MKSRHLEIKELAKRLGVPVVTAIQQKPSTPERQLEVGGKYEWSHGEGGVLIYRGYNWSSNGHWHQFSQVSNPDKIWCECLDSDLSGIVKVQE